MRKAVNRLIDCLKGVFVERQPKEIVVKLEIKTLHIHIHQNSSDSTAGLADRIGAVTSDIKSANESIKTVLDQHKENL